MVSTPFKFDLKTASLVGGLFLTGSGILAAAAPVFQSDPPPLAGKERVQKIDDEVRTIRSNLDSVAQTQLFLAQGFWTREIIQDQILVDRDPNNIAARQQLAIAQQNLRGIEKKLYMK